VVWRNRMGICILLQGKELNFKTKLKSDWEC
jgi:hypothetical protein